MKKIIYPVGMIVIGVLICVLAKGVDQRPIAAKKNVNSKQSELTYDKTEQERKSLPDREPDNNNLVALKTNLLPYGLPGRQTPSVLFRFIISKLRLINLYILLFDNRPLIHSLCQHANKNSDQYHNNWIYIFFHNASFSCLNIPPEVLIISQIRNARELVHLRRICERQNHKAQCAADAKHLDFGVIIS